MGLGGAVGDLLGMQTPGELFVAALTSERVENQMIDRFNLLSVYKKKRYVSARKKLESRTNISLDRKSGVITISVSDADANRSAALANGYADELERVMLAVNASAAAKQRLYLQDQIKQAKEQLDDASNQVSRYASENKTIDLDEEGKALVGAYAALQGQLIAAQSDLKGLQEIYADRDVHITQAKARISELQRQLTTLSGSNGQKKEASHTGQFPSIGQLPILGVTYLDLFRTAKIREAVFQALTQQYEFVRLQEESETTAVQVLSPAAAPEQEKYPVRVFVAVLGPFLFLFGAIVYLLSVAAWNELSVDDPKRHFVSRLREVLLQNSH